MDAILAPYREGLHGVDRRAYAIVTATLVSIAARMSVYTFLGIYFTQSLGFSLTLMGFAFLVENIARGFISPVAGALSDRWGRRPVLLATASATAVVVPLFLLVETPRGLVAWSILLGLAAGGTWPTTSALLMDLAPPDKRQTVLSLNYTAIAAGYTLGVAPAGFVLQWGFPALAAMSTGGFVLVVIILLVATRSELPSTRAPGDAPLSFFRSVGHAPRDPAFLLLAALGFVFPLGIGLLVTVAPLYAKIAGQSEASIGLALAANGPLLIALAIPVATWVSRWGPYRHLGISAAILAASYLALAASGSFAALVAMTIVFTVSELVFSSALPAAVGALAPPGLRGAYQGAWTLVFGLAYGAALLLTSLAERHLGWAWTWGLWAGITAFAALGLALARPLFRRLADARAQENGEATSATSPA